ncbi:MAG: glycosyltransferase family 4 protein, partial [Saccharolobus sp.]
ERRYIKELLLLIKYLPKFINKKVRVLIIGDGPLKDVVENFVKKLENRNSMIINYIPSVPRFQLKDYYNEIKVMILLSKCDGLPNTIIEAMACCCVVISTPVGGIPSVIDDDVTGFIVNGDNIILETSLLLKKLLNNDEIIKRIGITAMQRVFKSFSVVPVRIKWKYILDQ